MAVGGYGPVQYLRLLEDRAPSLNPALVVIGVYLGNDLSDAHHDFYLLSDGKRPERSKIQTKNKKFLSGARDWLSRNSVSYNVIRLSGGKFLGRVKMEEAARNHPHLTVIDGPGLKHAFEPKLCIRVVDTTEPKIASGFDKTSISSPSSRAGAYRPISIALSPLSPLRNLSISPAWLKLRHRIS